MRKIIYLILIFLLSYYVAKGQNGYEIQVKIKHLPNADLILGYHLSDKLIPADTVKTNSNGYAVFRGKEKLPGGMYFIFLPSANYFDIIIDKDQHFYIENDTSDFLKNFKVKGSEQNRIFVDYQRFLKEQTEKAQELRTKRKEKSGDKKAVADIDKKLSEINKKFEDYYNKLQQEHGDMFFAKFLKATREVRVPDSIKGQKERYYYYRFHYFDNFDISDPRMLRSPIYYPKIDRFLDKVISQHPDTLIKEVDNILNKTRHDKELYKDVLIHLFNKYARSQIITMENVYVHIADYYIRDADWDTTKFKRELPGKIAKKKNCLIGNTAKDLLIRTLPSDTAQISELKKYLEEMRKSGIAIEKQKPELDDRKDDLALLLEDFFVKFQNPFKLSQLTNKYIIIWFMEPDCSHCRKETPEFYEYYIDTLSKQADVAVLCFYMTKGVDDWKGYTHHIEKWMNFVQEHNLWNWYNVWNPFETYRQKYDIFSTPTLYLLDKDKKIVAKRIGYKDAGELIMQMEKEEKNKTNN